jgi:hypothetical protein
VESSLSRINARIDVLESHLLSRHPHAAEEAPLPIPTPSATSVAAISAFPPIQGPPRPQCARYCKCQCHRTSFIRMPACLSQSNQTISFVCSLPSKILGRTLAISASWGPMNIGVPLHLAMPTYHPISLYEPCYKLDLGRLRRQISSRELLPTSVDWLGDGYLMYVARFTLLTPHLEIEPAGQN